MAAHWVGLTPLVDQYFSDLQHLLDTKDEDGLVQLAKDFAQGLAVFAGAPLATP